MAALPYMVVVKANKSSPSVSRESDHLASEDGPNSEVNEIVINN